MSSNDLNAWMNSRWFLISILGGYGFLFTSVITQNPAWMYGMILAFVAAIIGYIFEKMAAINILSGAITTDAVIYADGLKPQTQKFHIVFITPLKLDCSQLDVEKLTGYGDLHSGELAKLEKQLLSQKSIFDATNTLLNEKRHNVESVVKAEYEKFVKFPEQVQSLYAYRCILIDKFRYNDDPSKTAFTQVIFITKRIIGLEFFTHQDSIRFRNMIVNTSLCYAMMNRWKMASFDLPVLFARYTDQDGFEDAKIAISSELISNIHVRVVDQMMTNQRAKYMVVDKKLENAETDKQTSIDKINELQQLLKVASSKPIESKRDQLANKKIAISKGALIFILVVMFGLIAFSMFAFGKFGLAVPGV